jgi:hypothetical protein
MNDWRLIPTGRPDYDEPSCPFCREAMAFQGFGSDEPDSEHSNVWECANARCHRHTRITLTFTL